MPPGSLAGLPRGAASSTPRGKEHQPGAHCHAQGHRM